MATTPDILASAEDWVNAKANLADSNIDVIVRTKEGRILVHDAASKPAADNLDGVIIVEGDKEYFAAATTLWVKSMSDKEVRVYVGEVV